MLAKSLFETPPASTFSSCGQSRHPGQSLIAKSMPLLQEHAARRSGHSQIGSLIRKSLLARTDRLISTAPANESVMGVLSSSDAANTEQMHETAMPSPIKNNPRYRSSMTTSSQNGIVHSSTAPNSGQTTPFVPGKSPTAAFYSRGSTTTPSNRWHANNRPVHIRRQCNTPSAISNFSLAASRDTSSSPFQVPVAQPEHNQADEQCSNRSTCSSIQNSKHKTSPKTKSTRSASAAPSDSARELTMGWCRGNARCTPIQQPRNIAPVPLIDLSDDSFKEKPNTNNQLNSANSAYQNLEPFAEISGCIGHRPRQHSKILSDRQRTSSVVTGGTLDNTDKKKQPITNAKRSQPVLFTTLTPKTKNTAGNQSEFEQTGHNAWSASNTMRTIRSRTFRRSKTPNPNGISSQPHHHKRRGNSSSSLQRPLQNVKTKTADKRNDQQRGSVTAMDWETSKTGIGGARLQLPKQNCSRDASGWSSCSSTKPYSGEGVSANTPNNDCGTDNAKIVVQAKPPAAANNKVKNPNSENRASDNTGKIPGQPNNETDDETARPPDVIAKHTSHPETSSQSQTSFISIAPPTAAMERLANIPSQDAVKSAAEQLHNFTCVLSRKPERFSLKLSNDKHPVTIDSVSSQPALPNENAQTQTNAPTSMSSSTNLTKQMSTCPSVQSASNPKYFKDILLPTNPKEPCTWPNTLTIPAATATSSETTISVAITQKMFGELAAFMLSCNIQQKGIAPITLPMPPWTSPAPIPNPFTVPLLPAVPAAVIPAPRSFPPVFNAITKANVSLNRLNPSVHCPDCPMTWTQTFRASHQLHNQIHEWLSRHAGFSPNYRPLGELVYPYDVLPKYDWIHFDANIITANQTLQWRHKLHLLYMAALTHAPRNPVNVKLSNFFHRCKCAQYFNVANIYQNQTMWPYPKKAKGTLENPLNNRLCGLFFTAEATPYSVNMSPFGNTNFAIEVVKLYRPETHELFFGDFYEGNKPTAPRHVTLVIAQKNAPPCQFCRQYLMQLDAFHNNFFMVRPLVAGGYEFVANGDFQIEYFVTEPVHLIQGFPFRPIKWLDGRKNNANV